VPKMNISKVFYCNISLTKKISTAEAHRILVETCGDHVLSETICRDWFRCFKNNDFDVEDKERSGAPKKFEDEELEALLHEDSCQILTEFAKLLGVDHTTFGSIRNDSKTRTLDVIPVEAEIRRTASSHV